LRTSFGLFGGVLQILNAEGLVLKVDWLPDNACDRGVASLSHYLCFFGLVFQDDRAGSLRLQVLLVHQMTVLYRWCGLEYDAVLV